MKTVSRFIKYWLPPILWMTLIFYLSSRIRISVSEEYIVNFLIFKLLHVMEYAMLYFLLFRAFYNIKNDKLSLKQRFAIPFIITVLYAISDELHQSFVPTREGKLKDVIIDTLGITLMYIYLRTYLKSLKKILI